MSGIFKAYQENEKPLKKYLSRYLSNPQDVDELAHEAFLRAFAAEATQTIRLPRSFLYRTAKNLALDFLSRKSNLYEQNFEDPASSAVIPDDKRATPEKNLGARQMLMVFAQAVARLPERRRRIFVLSKLHDWQYKEIAEEIGVSVSTVEKEIAASILFCHERLVRKGYDSTEFRGRTEVGAGNITDKTVAKCGNDE